MRRFALLLVPAIALAAPAPPNEASFQGEIRPMLKQYCLTCHSAAAHTADVNLERFASYDDVLKSPRIWQKAVEQLSLGEMPPKPMPQPSAEQRTRLLAWVNGALTVASRAHAGDPGPVVLRRLNNAEYTYTIRDLTHVPSLDPVKEFPVDGAAGEGFMNTGNALAMSPSLITKYLDAGKAIASHAVLLPDGIRFSPVATRRDWTNELLAEIRGLYGIYTEAGGADTVTQQGMALDKNKGGAIPLRKYLKASLALRGSTGSVESIAKRDGLSPKYLGLLVELMKSQRTSPLLDGLRAKWRAGEIDPMLAEIAVWQNTLWKFSSVGHIGKVGGPKSWLEPVDPVVAAQDFHVKLAAPAGSDEVTVYLTAHDAGDGSAGDFVEWREPRIAIPGRKPLLLRDVRDFVGELTARRERIFAATAASLAAIDDPQTRVDPEALKAWSDFLGISKPSEFKLDLLTKKIDKAGTYDFVQGWGSTDTPMLLANSSAQNVRIPGGMRAHGVVVHPSVTLKAAVGWRSPMNGTLRVDGTIVRTNPECGSGITWSLELRRGSTRQQLATGTSGGGKPIKLGPFERVRVQPGDLISVLIGPRNGDHSCDLTDIDLHLASADRKWGLSEDVSGSVLAANPHSDLNGNEGVWSFYTQPLAGATYDTLIPAGSILARWQSAEQPEERRKLAQELQALLTSPAPAEGTPDGALYRQLSSLAGPLFAGELPKTVVAAKSSWGLDPAMFGKRSGGAAATDTESLFVRAPSVLAVRLPADLVANGEFVTTGALDQTSGAEGSVQLEVLGAKPEDRAGLLPTATLVRDMQGMWSSNNQTVAYGMPVVVNEHSAARKRVEAAFEEFRQMFPASLCYTKIVPVDEVVTLTLFYREDDQLSRLMLNAKEKARLDRLWDELHYVSRDALTSVDAFEQIWQFATQDADPSAFEPLRKPIHERAAAFRQRLLDTEPRHIDAVLEFADRAYRRPLADAERTQLRNLYSKLRAEGLPHDDSIRLLLARVLVTPSFLYRAEHAPSGNQAAFVSSYELADRLSYFLWSSMPDAELRAAAASGKLRTPAGLEAQTHRMLRDPRVARMAKEFGAAWLHIYDFDSLDEKSERHFPEFRDLRATMAEEPVRFLTNLFSSNASIRDVIDSDYAFVNEPLAKYYGIPGIHGPEWRRVDGVKQYGRGGVIGEAAVLAKESGASRTSPILRGIWVLEVLLGENMPRPPKDVPVLPTDEATETLTVRQLTEKHTSDKRCSGCHSRSDPYGYTLERFDAIGRYRDRDLANRAIDDRAKFKDGSEAQGIDGLRQYLLTKRWDDYVHQFSKKLLGYSLGRSVQLSDEPLLKEIETKLAASGYHAGTVIDMIVASRQFQEIRGRDYEPDPQ
ncbi:MAG TPA: DUF1592 domain-containing protein [Bryobacteraceae bacterium]